MKFAIIENNKIVNIIEANNDFIEKSKLNAFELTDENIHINAELIDDVWVNKIEKVIDESIPE